jgi:hypothetical protein
LNGWREPDERWASGVCGEANVGGEMYDGRAAGVSGTVSDGAAAGAGEACRWQVEALDTITPFIQARRHLDDQSNN